MKITIQHDYVSHIADFLDPNDPDRLPDVEQAVDSCLYFLSLYYKPEKIQEVARDWEL